MGHAITAYDQVYSTRSTEWHGLARQVPVIDEAVVGPLLFPIVKLGITGTSDDGESVDMSDFIGYGADIRSRSGGIRPLAIHSKAYVPITNGEVWNAMRRALSDEDHVVSTTGTLDGLNRFFISVQLAGGKGAFLGPRGDAFLAYLNFITSHDGTVAMQSHDSNVRIVCNNTLNASVNSSHKFSVHIRHTAGANLEIVGMSDYIKHTLECRNGWIGNLHEMESLKLSESEARRAIVGWKWEDQKNTGRFAAPTLKDISEIVRLFREGKGNQGQTVYDLLNGVTEYYTTGGGVQRGPAAYRASNHCFGSAARAKTKFNETVTRGGNISANVDRLLGLGDKAVRAQEEAMAVMSN